MTARATWKGSIRLGEVVVPVALYAAATMSKRISFHIINRKTGHRVHREYVDDETGKPVDREAIARRPGWDAIAAVRAGQIHELDGADVLAPGPSLMVGLRRIHEIVQAFQSAA